MYAEGLDTHTNQPHLPSFETGWLFCAGSFAVAAIVVLLLPHDAVTWVVAHLG